MLRAVFATLLGLASALSGCACEVDELGLLPEPGGISGRVCDPGEGRGIFNARVFVVVNRGGKVEEIEDWTDPDGGFELSGIPPGSYDVNVARGSFTTTLPDVPVEEALVTALDEAACLAPDTVRMTVYTGHDSVEDVLTRLGYDDFAVVETHSGFGEHDDTTPSWIVEAFGDAAAFADQDILFINCGPHEWAIDQAASADVEAALQNLRDFVEQGGSLYFSDWAYDFVEALYPDAVDWIGDDALRDDAQRGLEQEFLAHSQDSELTTILGRERASLRFNQSRIALATSLGEGARALLSADVRAEDTDGGERIFEDVPVLLEIKPAGSAGGRILFTSFHNGPQNTPDMDQVLRAIIFSL